jgi:hypothetical protein
MSNRSSWMRADVIVVAILVIAAGAALTSRNWRKGRVSASPSSTAAADAPLMQRLDSSGRPHHRSQFNDSLTARAESLCVRQVEGNLQSQYGELFAATVTETYGVGDVETGAGDSLDVDGIARSPSGRISKFHCGMADFGSHPASPMVTHVESP